MADPITGGGLTVGAAPLPTFQKRQGVRVTVALLILVGLAGAAYLLHSTPGRGAAASFSLLTGVALGFVFQRGRFCFFCILRDFITHGNSGPLYAILTALAVGGIGYAVVFGAFLPNPMSGRLPPEAHIGPVSWVVVVAGLAFGLGMALSGACISGHLYRLGAGSTQAPFALVGSLLGFGIGFYTWPYLYLNTLAKAPIPWLPAWLGYGGALLVHLLVLTLLGLWLLRWTPARQAQPGGSYDLHGLSQAIFVQRWPPLVTGALVGLIGVFAYLRVEPLGVTAQLGSVTRTMMYNADLLGDRLVGLDTFAGCATQVVQTISDNGLLISGFVLAAFVAALLSNQFEAFRLTARQGVSATLGGVLMGWGAMTALGCTVGTLLSGISAFALSGWLFAIAVYAGVWIGIRAKLTP